MWQKWSSQTPSLWYSSLFANFFFPLNCFDVRAQRSRGMNLLTCSSPHMQKKYLASLVKAKYDEIWQLDFMLRDILCWETEWENSVVCRIKNLNTFCVKLFVSSYQPDLCNVQLCISHIEGHILMLLHCISDCWTTCISESSAKVVMIIMWHFLYVTVVMWHFMLG